MVALALACASTAQAAERIPADILVPDPALAATGTPAGPARGVDRWGREVVPVLESPAWVGDGLALVHPDADAAAAMVLLPLEAAARAARRGHWGDGTWRVQDAAGRIRGQAGDLVLVEGTVVAVGWAGDRLYLNFGTDRSTDVTARVERSALPAVAAGGVDPEALAGRRARLRGWLAFAGGPLLELTGPAQLELLP
ncbi:MAG: hypothetical protein U1E14_12040 [Geminicoccaceae bacterium]